MSRSHAPVFWALFGAGGMLAALFGPMLVFITGIAVPAGLWLPPGLMAHARMLTLARHWAGKAFIFAVVVLFMWHAAHRILKSLHDIGVHPGPAAKLACYGSALVVTLLAAWGLLAIGF